MAVTAVAAVLLAGLHARPGWRLLLFFPAAAAASGFLQSALHFCLGFGLKAVFNFGDPGKVDGVAQAQFRAMDRRRALRILGYSVLAGAAVALAAYGIG